MANKPCRIRNSGAVRIAAAQLNFVLNDFEGNFEKIRSAVLEADVCGADIVVFSELALSGYYPQDLVEAPDFLSRQQVAVDAVAALSKEVRAAIVIGAATANPGPGKPLRNSLLVFSDGSEMLRYHKQLLPDYNIFDERRHFEPGPAEAAVLNINGRKFGFVICEDAWNASLADYAVDPVQQAKAAGAELVISINASPSDIGKADQRHMVIGQAAAKHVVPLVYVNQVGGYDSLVFDGGSFFMGGGGTVTFEANRFEETVTIVDFIGADFFRPVSGKIFQGPHAVGDAEFYYKQLILGLRDYMAKTGFKNVVVGSSGGIDSALTLALAVDALGAENVTAVTMPSPYSSEGSVADSVALCENLGCVLHTYPIKNEFRDYVDSFVQAFDQTPSGLTQENLQARIRGTMLMAYSNHFGNLLLTTGNKSEMSVGYATLYGDMSGGLNLLGDLYKMEVFELARWYNAYHGRELIPTSIIDKAPSAELAPGQRDSDSLPDYPLLDAILKLHIENGKLRTREKYDAEAIVAGHVAKHGSAEAERVHKLVARAEYKRRQAPPIIRVRARAFGNGRQMPLTAKY